MKSAFRVARVRGIEIKIHWTFALAFVWIALGLGLQQGVGLAGVLAGLLYGIVFTAFLFACVTLHELAHSLVARRFGAKVRDITLLPIGGVARIEGLPTRPAHEFWMALAGPATNIVLATAVGAIALPVLGFQAIGGLGALLDRLSGVGFERLLVDLLLANLGLAFFNLLPAFPMDGGRVLRALLATRLGELNATRIAARVGQGLAVLLGLAGLLTGALNLLLIAGFIFFGAEQEWRGTQLTTALRQTPASAALIRGSVTLSPYDPLARAIDTTLRGGQADFAVFDRGYLVGVLTREDVAEGFRQRDPNVRVGHVMNTDFPVASAHETLLDLQRKIKASGSSAISVVEEGRFLGLATLESVRNALRLFGTPQWRPVGS